jgi:hypothetical protein
MRGINNQSNTQITPARKVKIMKKKQHKTKHKKKVNKSRTQAREPVPPPLAPFTRANLANLKNLDDLLALAERYAEHHMRTIGSLPVTLLMLTSGGLAMIGKDSLAKVSKDEFVQVAKYVCVAYGATACVFVAEAWRARGKVNDQNEIVPPSQNPDRRKIVMLVGESLSEGQKQKDLPIIRSKDGKFSSLGQSEVKTGPLGGRFPHFLPTEPPDEEMKRAVKAILKIKPTVTGKLPK